MQPSSSLQGRVTLVVAPDDGIEPVRALLRSAERSLDLFVYLLSSQTIIAELHAAQERGVRVRVLLEQRPLGGEEVNRLAATALADAGVSVRWSNPVFRFTHAKVIVADEERAAIMTLNLTQSSFTRNREFAVLVEDPTVVRFLVRLFVADWDRQPTPPVPDPLVVSPENARPALLNLFQTAKASLDVYAPAFEDDEIASALAAAARRGVAVRLVTNPPTQTDPNRGERRQLLAQGGAVGFLASPTVHAKVVIVDGRRAFVGSQNFTNTSLDQNREVGIVLDDPGVLRRLQEMFTADWERTTQEGMGESRSFFPLAA